MRYDINMFILKAIWQNDLSKRLPAKRQKKSASAKHKKKPDSIGLFLSNKTFIFMLRLRSRLEKRKSRADQSKSYFLQGSVTNRD